MDTQQFGPRFLFAIVGLALKSLWARLERKSAVSEPLRILYLSPGSKESTSAFLARRTLVPEDSLVTNLRRKWWHVALVAFTALMAEILIIILPGIPFSSMQFWEAARASRIIATTILAGMLLVWFWVVLRTSAPVPRSGGTVGSVAMFVAGSEVAGDMKFMGDIGADERERIVNSWDRGVAIKRRTWEGMGERWVVDYCERPAKEGYL